MMDKTVKIAKYLAQAGVASRRKAEALVKQGLVSVNGKISADPALRVNPKTDKILYRGKPLSPAQKVLLSFEQTRRIHLHCARSPRRKTCRRTGSRGTESLARGTAGQNDLGVADSDQ